MRKRLRKKRLARLQWPKVVVGEWRHRKQAQYEINKLTSVILEDIISIDAKEAS